MLNSPSSPLHVNKEGLSLSKHVICEFSSFFKKGVFDYSSHGTGWLFRPAFLSVEQQTHCLVFHSAPLGQQKIQWLVFAFLESFCQKWWLLKTNTVLLNYNFLCLILGSFSDMESGNSLLLKIGLRNDTSLSGCLDPLISQSSSLHKFSGNLLQPSLTIPKFLWLCCQQADKLILKHVSCLGCSQFCDIGFMPCWVTFHPKNCTLSIWLHHFQLPHITLNLNVYKIYTAENLKSLKSSVLDYTNVEWITYH